MKHLIVLVLFLFGVTAISPQDSTGNLSDTDIGGVYRVYPITRLIAVQSGQALGFVPNSAGRTVDSPYFTVGLSDDGVLSIQSEPYRFEWVEETPGHLRFWPAHASNRYAYQYRSWNVQPIVDPNALVVTEYNISLDFEDDTAIAGEVLYFQKIVPGGTFSNRWMEQEENAMDTARELVDANSWR